MDFWLAHSLVGAAFAVAAFGAATLLFWKPTTTAPNLLLLLATGALVIITAALNVLLALGLFLLFLNFGFWSAPPSKARLQIISDRLTEMLADPTIGADRRHEIEERLQKINARIN